MFIVAVVGRGRAAAPPPPPAIEFSNDEELRAETNSTVLNQYYRERQQKFRGTMSARWKGNDGVSPDLLLTDGTKLTVDQVAEGYELIISQLGGQPKAPGGEGSVWNGVDTLIDPVDAAGLSALQWLHQPDLIVRTSASERAPLLLQPADERVF